MAVERNARCYPLFACFCIVHGIAFGALGWYGYTHPVVTSTSSFYLPHVVRSCEALFFSWPLWIIVMWRCSRGGFQAILPLVLSILSSTPGLVALLAVYSIPYIH